MTLPFTRGRDGPDSSTPTRLDQMWYESSNLTQSGPKVGGLDEYTS